MKERPILFSGPMVRAILEDRKTQTRRIIKPQPEKIGDGYLLPLSIDCPYGWIKNRLWVRETFWPRPFRTGKDMINGADTWEKVYYDANMNHIDRDQLLGWGWKKKPSIFMPRWASRITLEIVNIRVERVQDITETDSIKEGSQIPCSWLPKSCQQGTMTEREQFSRIWDSVNGKTKSLRPYRSETGPFSFFSGHGVAVQERRGP